jgi:hypothetical protein
MDVLGLFLWVIVALTALPLGRHALDENAALGLQAMTAGGGVVFSALFIALDHQAIWAWLAVACGVVGTLALSYAAAWLISDARAVSPAGHAAEAIDALLAGVTIPLYAFATVLSVLMALNIGIVT